MLNLVDVLQAPYFTAVAAIPALIEQQLISAGTPAATAATEAGVLGPQVQAFLQATYGLGPQAYLQLSGTGKLQGALAAVLGGASPAAALSAPSAALVLGDYVSDAVAVKTQQLNDAYNAAIAASAASTGAALVDTHSFYAAYETATGRFIPLTGNAKCCALVYGGGLTSLDGLHPSDTGYALIANVVIAKLNASFNAGIAPLTDAQISAINATDLYSPH